MIKGSWGPLPHAVQIVSGNLPGLGLEFLWVENVSYNFIQGGYTGPNSDNRGGPDVVGALKVWDSAGIVLTFKIPADQAPAPPTPTESATITGATINGAVHAPAPLPNLVTATHAGGALALPPGTWSGSSAVSTARKITGAGMGKTILDATGIEIARGKAVFVPRVAGVTISDMTIRGAAGSDENGAAVRDEGEGIGFTLRNVEVTDCQDGILTFASDITLGTCNFHDNGAKNGLSHEIYCNGSPTTTVSVSNVTSKCGTKSTHALKSRAGRTVISGGVFSGNPDASDNSMGGSVLDFPDGGEVTIDGATVVVTASGPGTNILAIGYGMESAKNATRGTTLALSNFHLSDKSGTGAKLECGKAIPNAGLTIGANCTYDGPKPPQLQGWGSVRGSFAASGVHR